MDDIILKLVKQHKTRNLAEIAKNLGIIILYEQLGNLNGFYNTAYRQKLIHINSNKPSKNTHQTNYLTYKAVIHG